jgi:hypothetical protein
MFTRAEIEFRTKACLAQLKLRVVVYSIALGVPPWIGFYALQKMGLNWGNTNFVRAVGVLFLGIYLVGVFRIIRRTQRDCDLICPKCKGLLGPQGGGLNATGECRKCGEKIVD